MPNLLADETSPYLQQHATNPVEWHVWNEDTLRIARDLDNHPAIDRLFSLSLVPCDGA